MITIVNGCNVERAREVFTNLQQQGAAILYPDKGENIRMINSFSVRNFGPGDVPRGAVVFSHGGKLTVKDSSGRVLARLKPGQTAVVEPRRTLRRIGGSDRLWRALRGGR